MFRRITGLFIILSFLLVKSTPLFAFNKLSKCVDSTHEHDFGGSSGEEKEIKQLEIIEDDFIDRPLINASSFTLAKEASDFAYPATRTIWLSLINPPPNLNV